MNGLRKREVEGETYTTMSTISTTALLRCLVNLDMLDD